MHSKLNVLSEENSLVHLYLKELRDVNIQKDRLRFRNNLQRIGTLIAFEISKSLSYLAVQTKTPLGIAETKSLEHQPVIGTILRAGIPLQSGIARMFDHADLAYISAYRKHHEDGSFDIKVEYIATPPLDQRILIIADPMIATGQSLVLSHDQFIKHGNPTSVHVAAVIASQAGIEYAQKKLPHATFWVGTIDDELNDHGYIVPGLGDAGDLSFGNKVEI